MSTTIDLGTEAQILVKKYGVQVFGAWLKELNKGCLSRRFAVLSHMHKIAEKVEWQKDPVARKSDCPPVRPVGQLRKVKVAPKTRGGLIYARLPTDVQDIVDSHMKTVQKHRYDDTVKLLMTASHWWTPTGAWNRISGTDQVLEITGNRPDWYGELQSASITDSLSFKSQTLSKQCPWCMCDENGGKGCDCYLVRYYKHNYEDPVGTYAHCQCPPASIIFELNVDPNVSVYAQRQPGEPDWVDAFLIGVATDSDHVNRIESVISNCQKRKDRRDAELDESQRKDAADSLPLGWGITTTPEGVALYTNYNTKTTYLQPVYDNWCCYGLCLPLGWRIHYTPGGGKLYIDDSTGTASFLPVYSSPDKIDFLSRLSAAFPSTDVEAFPDDEFSQRNGGPSTICPSRPPVCSSDYWLLLYPPYVPPPSEPQLPHDIWTFPTFPTSPLFTPLPSSDEEEDGETAN